MHPDINTVLEQARYIVKLPCDTPEDYWECWAEALAPSGSGTHYYVRTYRGGEAGRSDAQFIVDRCASGLHFGEVI